jgi:hypothetical protein
MTALISLFSLGKITVLFFKVVFPQYFIVLALLIAALTHTVSPFLELLFVELQHLFSLPLLLVDEVNLMLPIGDEMTFLLFDLLLVFAFDFSHLLLKL